MQYKIKNTNVVFQRHEFGTHFPNTSLPVILSQGDLDALGLETLPDPEPIPLTEEEIKQQTANQALHMQSMIVLAMDNLFDRVAQERNYDSRITCALRAGYPGPFHEEGVAFATWMDNQNAKAFDMLLKVQEGKMRMPLSVEAAIELLDPMVWPNKK